MLHARALIPTLALLVLVATPAYARPPISGEQIAEGLVRAGEADESDGLLQLLMLLEHLDALTPDAALAALSALGQGHSLRAARARLERAALTNTPVPDAVLTEALAVSELSIDEVSDSRHLAALHRRLARRLVAELGAAFDPDDPERRWTAVGVGPAGAMGLEPLVSGRGRVVLHVAVPFAVDAAVTGALRIGATGGLALSLVAGGSGSFLGVAQALERAVPDQLEVPISLAAGRHILLVTLRPNPGEPALLRVRFDVRGGATPRAASLAGPLSWSAFEVPAAAPELPWNSDVRHLIKTRPSLEGLLLARALGLPDLLDRGAADRETHAFEDRLATSRLPSPAFLLALGSVRRPEDRASLLLARLAGGCATCARDPSLLLALAEHTAGRGQLVQAAALVAEASDNHVRAGASDVDLSGLLTFMRARLARLARSPEETLIAYDVAQAGITPELAAVRLRDDSERARLEVAQAALDLGRADLALAIVAALFERYPGRLDIGLTMLRAALAAGRPDLATALAETLAEQRRDRPTLALDAAAKLLARDRNDDRARARVLVDGALARLEWKPDGLVDAGRLLEAMADRAAAIAAFARALEVNPAHEDARRDLERLQGAEPVPLSLSLGAVLGAPVVDAQASFEVLGEEQFIKVRADGSATRWTRRFLRAQTVPAAREARTLVIRFDPTQESVRVLEANIRRAGALGVSTRTPAEPVPERLLQSIAEDWYGLYYDLRQLAIPFDHLERGDIIEVTWRIDPTGQLFPGVVDIFELLSDRVPKHLHRIIVETPPGIELTTRLALPAGMVVTSREETSELPAGGLRHLVEVIDLPGLPSESMAPGSAEVSPVWQATSFLSWREVASWYRALVEPQKVLTPAMKAFVAEVRGNKATPGEILTRLSDYVTREIRYVGLEFGIHGYKPYRTDQVWSRRFGDCKDKATLLSALMAEAGLDGEVTLVRTRKQGRLVGALPSLSLFDHAVLYLPSRDELVDPTATYYGLGELPKDDQGAQILVLTPPDAPAELAVSRVDPAVRNGITGTYSVTLERRGRAGIQGTVAFLGTQAPAYRALLLDPASQRTRLEELMNRRFPGLTLRDFRISDPSDKRKPLELVFHADVPRFGQLRSEADGTLYVTRPTGIDGHLERFASEEQRRLPLVLGPPMHWDVIYRYILPDGHRARELPAGGEATGAFGSYRVSWLDEGAIVTVRAQLSYAVDQVSAADYAGLRDFVRAFDAVVASPLVLTPVPAEGL